MSTTRHFFIFLLTFLHMAQGVLTLAHAGARAGESADQTSGLPSIICTLYGLSDGAGAEEDGSDPQEPDRVPNCPLCLVAENMGDCDFRLTAPNVLPGSFDRLTGPCCVDVPALGLRMRPPTRAPPALV